MNISEKILSSVKPTFGLTSKFRQPSLPNYAQGYTTSVFKQNLLRPRDAYMRQ